MQSGQYILELDTQNSTQYLRLSPLAAPINYTDGLQENESQAALCNGTGERQTCNDSGANTWRIIEVSNLYDKVNNQILDCPNGETTSNIPCGDTDAKEIQFCVHVGDRRNNSIETLCTAMTNFQQ